MRHYIDDEIWYEYKPENFYFKPQYINKTSRDLTYGKVDGRYRKGDYSIGYTGLYSDDNLESGLSMGVSKKKEINHTLSLEVKWDGYYFSDQETSRVVLIWKIIKINYKINDKTTLTNIFDYNDVKGKEILQVQSRYRI